MFPTPSLDSSLEADNVLPDYSMYATCTPPPDYLTLEDQATSDLVPLQYLEPVIPLLSTVTNQSCHDLLSFLYSVDQMLKTIPQGLQRLYMCRAELRYVRWLQVLQREKPTHTVTSRMIIPPLDVMLCWYAHMLSPFRYHDDLVRNSWEHVFNYPLPLEKTRQVKTKSGTGKDPLSERFWSVLMPGEPYELDITELQNDDRTFTCVFCQATQASTWTEYVRIRYESSSSITCLNCGSESSSQTLSCYQFVRDILESSETRILFKQVTCRLLMHCPGTNISSNGTINRGLMLDSDGEKAKSNTEKGIKVHLMARFMKDHDDSPKLTSSMLDSSATCDWNRTLQLLKSVRKRGGKDRFGEDSTWNVLLDTIKSSYFGIVTPLCIDLVQAVGRQYAFLKNVVTTDWTNVATLRFAIHRYMMFLTLLKQQPDTFPIVPTVDIDLSWHVHMVSSPQDYVNYCVDCFGKVINHDDIVPEGNQIGGAVLMAMAWNKKFKEPYTTASFVADHNPSLPSVVKWVKKKATGLKKLGGNNKTIGSDDDYLTDEDVTPPLNFSNLSLSPSALSSTRSTLSSLSSTMSATNEDKYRLFLNAMTDIALHNQDAVNAWYGHPCTPTSVDELDRHVLYFGSYGYIGTTTTPVTCLTAKYGTRYRSY